MFHVMGWCFFYDSLEQCTHLNDVLLRHEIKN